MRPLSVFPQAVLTPFFSSFFKKAFLISLHFKHTWLYLICNFIFDAIKIWRCESYLYLKCLTDELQCSSNSWTYQAVSHETEHDMTRNLSRRQMRRLKIFKHPNHLQVSVLTMINTFHIWPEYMKYGWTKQQLLNNWQTASLGANYQPTKSRWMAWKVPFSHKL